MGVPQIIQVMNGHDLDILKPMVTWGYLHFKKPPHGEATGIAKLTQITWLTMVLDMTIVKAL